MSEAGSPLLPSALDVFGSTPATLRALLIGLPEDTVSRPGDEGWSAKNVVAHLVALYGPTLVDRIRPMLEQDEPPIPNADEAETLKSLGAAQQAAPGAARRVSRAACRRRRLARRHVG